MGSGRPPAVLSACPAPAGTFGVKSFSPPQVADSPPPHTSSLARIRRADHLGAIRNCLAIEPRSTTPLRRKPPAPMAAVIKRAVSNARLNSRIISGLSPDRLEILAQYG